MTTEIWHRGKVRTFIDEAKAKEYLEEIAMANKKKKPVKTGSDPAPVVRVETRSEVSPKGCGCDVTVEENNLGGFSVTHPSRLGNPISASVRSTGEAEAWLATVHAEEAA